MLTRHIVPLVLAACATLVLAQTPSPSKGANAREQTEVQLTYLGNAGWQITDGKTIVLVDPYLTQFRHPPAPATTGQPTDPQTMIAPDTEEIDEKIRRADYILITHGHLDHALDAPYIAKKTGATIIGSETVANLARACDVPDAQIIVVRGGEDYAFGVFSLKVIPSIHSALFHKHYFSSRLAGNAPPGLKAPLKAGDFVEGQSVAYLLRLAGHEVLAMGSMNYIEREMEGLRPDIALVGANNASKSFGGEALSLTGLLLPTRGLSSGIQVSVQSVGRYNPLPSEIIGSADGFTYCIFPIGPLLGKAQLSNL